MIFKQRAYMTAPLFTALSPACNTPVHYEIRLGADIQHYIVQLNRWRASLFSEYPYLFQPTDIEDHAVAGESSLPFSTMICAFAGDILIGCLVGMPLPQYHDMSKDCYASDSTLQMMQDKYPNAFFINELFIDPQHRSLRLMQGLYEKLEQAIKQLHPACTIVCLLKIDDSLDHPLRPQAYESSLATERIEHALVTTYDFIKTGDAVNLTWSTITSDDTLSLEEHTVHVWCKTLSECTP